MPRLSNHARRALRASVAFVLTATLVGILFDATHTWFDGGRFITRDTLYVLAWWSPLVYLIAAHLRARRGRPAVVSAGDHDPAAIVLLLGLLIALLCNIPRHPWFFFFAWFRAPTQAGLCVSGVERLALLTLLLTPLLLVRRRLAPWLLSALLLAQILAFRALWRFTDGLALYRDDHPSFLLRLHEFVHTFPARVVFNPWWNAGVVNSVGTSSGVASVALPFLPLWRLLPVHAGYTPLLGVLLIVAMPLLAIWALRAMRASWTAAAAAGLLTLGVSRYYFVWTLHFGTIGAGVAMAFLIPTAAFAYRLCVLRRSDARTLAALVACAFFLLQWPPCFIMAATLSLGFLWNRGRWQARTLLRGLVALLVLLLLLLPELLAIAQSSELLAYVTRSATADHGNGVARSWPAWPVWRDFLRATFGKRLIETHPLIAFLGVAGVALLPQRRARRWLLPPIATLLLLAAWGPVLLPKMQLERMAVPAMLLAVIPAALWLGRLLRSGAPRLAIARAALLALLLLGISTVAKIYAGKGYAGFNALPPEITRLVACLTRRVPPEGRVLFLGSNIHAFGHGHIAYLPILTGREMMACDYYAFPPDLVEYNYPPRPWRDSAEGIAAFARIHGVTHLLTYKCERVDILKAAPALFRACDDPDAEGFFLFEVIDARGGRFWRGSGKVEAESGRLCVTADAGADNQELVLRYNWDPRLTVQAPAELFPCAITNSVTFIGLRPHGARAMTIRARPW